MDSKSYIATVDRNIYLNGLIDSESAGKVGSAIIEIGKYDDIEEEKLKTFERKPIHLYINSWGGSMAATFGIIDIVENSKTPIYTYNNGVCSSAGLDILVSGHKKFGSKRSSYLFHQCNSELNGDYQRLKEDFKLLDGFNDMLKELYLNKTKMTKEFIENIIEKKIDYYFFSKEALELGAIDSIIGEENLKEK